MLFNKKIEKLVFVALLAISSLNAKIYYDRQNQMATCTSIKDAIEFFSYNNKDITTLKIDIEFEKIHPDSVDVLAFMISENTTITKLHLNFRQWLAEENNGIGNKTIAYLVAAIENNSTITELNLELKGQNIDLVSTLIIAAALANNKNITKLLLNFESDNLDLNTLKPIIAYCYNNKVIKQFKLRFPEKLLLSLLNLAYSYKTENEFDIKYYSGGNEVDNEDEINYKMGLFIFIKRF